MSVHNKKIDYDRAALMLKDGMTPKEVAAQFGCSVTAVHMAQSKGRLPKGSRRRGTSAGVPDFVGDGEVVTQSYRCMVLSGYDGEPCMNPAARTFITVEGGQMALCGRHDEEFYGLCIGAANVPGGKEEADGRTHAFLDALRGWSTSE